MIERLLGTTVDVSKLKRGCPIQTLGSLIRDNCSSDAPTDWQLINAYYLYVALMDSHYEYTCNICGIFPPVLLFNLCKKTAFDIRRLLQIIYGKYGAGSGVTDNGSNDISTDVTDESRTHFHIKQLFGSLLKSSDKFVNKSVNVCRVYVENLSALSKIQSCNLLKNLKYTISVISKWTKLEDVKLVTRLFKEFRIYMQFQGVVTMCGVAAYELQLSKLCPLSAKSKYMYC